MPKVSVIIPMYNSVDYLAECLASVKSQTLGDIEVICIDDASTDKTAALYNVFARGDERFSLISFPENRGRSAGRNQAIAQARGEFLAFLDADDWYPSKTVLERLYQAAHDAGADIVGGSYSEFDNQTNRVREDFGDDALLSAYTFAGEGRIEFADWQGDIGFQRFLYRRSLVVGNAIEFPPFTQHAVPLFLVRAMVAAGWFQAVPDVVYRHRHNHKPPLMGSEWIEDAVESIAEILAISHEHGFSQLRERQVKALLVYAADSLGLFSGERGLLQARAKAIQSVASSKVYRQLGDILGSYRALAGDVLKQYSVD